MRDQFGVQFDGERDQAERLIAFALFTSIYHDRRFLAETAWRGGLVHLAFYFLGFGFFEVSFFQGRNRIGSNEFQAGEK
jgi:hypothetical protein